MTLKEIELPSGAKLRINLAPFADSRALYQSVMRELRGIHYSATMDVEELGKDLFCIGFSSPDIEGALWQCFKRCTYEGIAGKGPMKIDLDTFEPVEARDDYLKVCVEVAKENIFPFAKSLFAEFKAFLDLMPENFQGSKPTTTS